MGRELIQSLIFPRMRLDGYFMHNYMLPVLMVVIARRRIRRRGGDGWI